MKKFLKIFFIWLIIAWALYFAYSKFAWTWKWTNNQKQISNSGYEQANNMIEVTKQSFNSSIKATWTTKIRNEQSLRFNVDWKVVAILFNVWDKVKKWDTIVKLASEEIQNEIKKQKISLEDAKRKLKEYLEDLRSSGIKKSQLDLELSLDQLKQKERSLEELKATHQRNIQTQQLSLQQAKNAYNVLKKETEKNIANMSLNDPDRENTLKERAQQLKKAELDYEDFKAKFDSKLKQEINEHNNKLQDIYFSLKNSVSDIKSNLKEVNKIYWLNNETSFQHYAYFAAKDSSYKERWRTHASESYSKFLVFEEAMKQVTDSQNTKEIVKALKLQKDFYESFYKATNTLIMWFDESIESIWFEESVINWYKSNFSSMRSSARSSTSSIISKIDEINNMKSVAQIERDLKDKRTELEQNVNTLKISMKKLLTNQQFDVKTESQNKKDLEIKLVQAKIDLDKQEFEFQKMLKDQNTELLQAEIALKKDRIAYQDQVKEHNKLSNLSKNQNYISLDNEVKQQEIALNNIYEKLDKYVIKAPFDGVISKIDMKIWDRLNSDNQQNISIVDPDTVEIESSVTQADVIKIKKWMLVSIKTDTYKDEEFTWTIIELNTTPTQDPNWYSSWPKKFKIVTSLNNPKKLKLYSWISAVISIDYNKIPSSVVVPYTAVNSDESGEKYVTVLEENGEKKKVYVEVWFTDWNFYQILSWLKEWQMISEIDYDPSRFKPAESWNEYGGEMIMWY